MKKLGKLTLKQMENEMTVIGSDEQKGFFGGCGWLSYAQSQIGVEEFEGCDENNPIIMGYFQSTTYYNAPNDETPWCSAFVNWCVEESGDVGTNSAAASSWSTWGDATGNPVAGDIGVRSDGHHVVIVESVNPDGTLNIIEGNADNKVKRSTISASGYDFRTK